MRSIGLAALALILLISCGVNPKTCTPKSCTGCCDDDGECLAGTGLFECGVSGAKCERCEVTDTCNGDGVIQRGLCQRSIASRTTSVVKRAWVRAKGLPARAVAPRPGPARPLLR